MAIRRRPRVFLEMNSLQDLTDVAGHPVFARSNVAINCYVDWRYNYDSGGFNTFTPCTDAADLGAAMGRMYERHAAVFAGEGITLGQRFFSCWQAWGGCGAFVGSFGNPFNPDYPTMKGLFWNPHDKPFERYRRYYLWKLQNVGGGTSGTFDLKIRIGSTDYTLAGVSATVTRTALASALASALAGSGRTTGVVDANGNTNSVQLDAEPFYIGIFNGSADDTAATMWISSQSPATGKYFELSQRPQGEYWLDYAFPYPYPRSGAGVRAIRPLTEQFLDGWESYRAANGLPHCPLWQVVSESVVPELFNTAFNYEGDNDSEGWFIDFQRHLDYISSEPELRLNGKTIKQWFDDMRLLDNSLVPEYERNPAVVGTFQIYRNSVNGYAMQRILAMCKTAWSQARYRALRQPLNERYVGARTGEYSLFVNGGDGNFRFQPPKPGDADYGKQFMEQGYSPGIDCQCPDCYLGPWEWYDQTTTGDPGRGTRDMWAAYKGVADPTTLLGKQQLNMSLYKDMLLELKKSGGSKLLMPYHAGNYPNYYTTDQLIEMWAYGVNTSAPSGRQLLDGVHWFAPGNAAAVASSLNKLEIVLEGLEEEAQMQGNGGWGVDNRAFSP